MSSITLEEAHANLPEVISRLQPGEEVVILRQNQPVAKLVGEATQARTPRTPGSAKGKILYMADDFDAPLEDFKEYME